MQFPGTPVFFCAWQSSGVSECLCFGQTFTLMKVVTSFLQLNFTINSENIFFDSRWFLQKKTGRREKLNQVSTLEKWVCDSESKEGIWRPCLWTQEVEFTFLLTLVFHQTMWSLQFLCHSRQNCWRERQHRNTWQALFTTVLGPDVVLHHNLVLHRLKQDLFSASCQHQANFNTTSFGHL